MPVYKSKKPTKDGRLWYFRQSYTEAGNYNQYGSKKYKTKEEAVRAESNFIIKKNLFVNEKSNTIEVLANEYIEYQRSRVRPTTLYGIQKVMRSFVIEYLGNYKIDQLSVKIIEEFKSKLPGSSDYKNIILKKLRALNKYSYKMYDTKTNVFDKIDNFKPTDKKEMKYFTLEEFNKFIDQVEPLNYKAFYLTLFFCGLRLGEALALTWNDIKNNNFIITKTLTSKIKGEEFTIGPPKTKSSERIIPIPKRVLVALNEYYNKISIVDGFNSNWFIFRDYTPLKETSVCDVKNKACDLAKVKRIRIHDFRHSCVSTLVNAGANITLVAKYLGHSDVKMTLNTYSHLYENELDKIREKLDNL